MKILFQTGASFGPGFIGVLIYKIAKKEKEDNREKQFYNLYICFDFTLMHVHNVTQFFQNIPPPLFLSLPELKTQVSFSDRPFVRQSICQLFTFSSSSQEPLGQFRPMHPLVKGNQIYSNEGPCIFPRGDNYEIAIIHRRNLKIFFTRTIMPIST